MLKLAPWAFGGFRSRGELKTFDVPPNVYPDTCERLGLIRRTFEVKSSLNIRDMPRATMTTYT